MRSFPFNVFVFILLSFITQAQAPSFQWVKGISSDVYPDVANPTVVIPDKNGDVYTCGNFRGTMDFDPGPGTATLSTSTGHKDIFVSKVDANGNYLWAKQIGDIYADGADAMVLDVSGNLCLTGSFFGVVDFDPGPGTYTLGVPGHTVESCFVLKLDNTGNLLWARSIEVAPLTSDYGFDIATDLSNNICISGEFLGVRDLDPGPGVLSYTSASTTSTDAFILKLDAAGNLVWVKQLGGNNARVQMDELGNVYAAGYLRGQGDFDPGPGVFILTTAANITNSYLCALDNNGNFLWARKIECDKNSYILWFKRDCLGNFYLQGQFQGNMDADAGPGVTTWTAPANKTLQYLLKLDLSANFVWGAPILTPGGNTGFNQMNIDGPGNVYLTGIVSDNTDFDPGPGTYTVPSPFPNQILLAKYTYSGSLAWAYSLLPTSNPGNGWGGQGLAVGTNISGDVCYAGQFGVTIDFDPSAGSSTLTTSFLNKTALFLLKFSQAASVLPLLDSTTAGGIKLCGPGNASLGAIGNAALNWYASPASTLSLGSGTIFTTPVLNTATTYYVANAGCGDIGPRVAVTITVNPLPAVTAAATKTMLCSGESATLEASGAATYSWNNSTSYSISVSPTVTSTYTVFGTGANDCKNSATVTLVYNPHMPVTQFSYPSVCEKSKDVVDPELSTGFDKGGIFSSSDPNVHQTSGMIQSHALSPGTYLVTYSVDVEGCPGTSQASLVVLPVATLSVSSQLTMTPGSSTTLSVSGGITYTWSPQENLSCVDCATPEVIAGNIKQYCVSSNLNSCITKACIDIVISCETSSDFSLPNAFTPNGDANNDAFCLQGWEPCINTFKVVVFSRWGEKIFESDKPDFCWDGFYKGKLLEQDVFVYTINATYSTGSSISKRGSISLIR